MIKLNYSFLAITLITLFVGIISISLVNVYLNNSFKESIVDELIEKNYKYVSIFVQEFENEMFKHLDKSVDSTFLMLKNDIKEGKSYGELLSIATTSLRLIDYFKGICIKSDIEHECLIKEQDRIVQKSVENPKSQYAEYDFKRKKLDDGFELSILYDKTIIYISATEYSNEAMINANSHNDIFKERLKKHDDNLQIVLISTTLTLFLIISALSFMLINEIKRKTRKLQESQDMLLVSSRFSAMGEMIGNIAHQWRQPLNIILSSITKIPVYKSLGKLDDEILNSSVQSISKQVKYLSQTIDDFREFYKKDDNSSFLINDAIRSAVVLMDSAIKNNFITLDLRLEEKQDFYFEGSKGKMIQVFLNLLNNSKDILIINEKKDRVILIESEIEGDSIKIYVCDSGGGIDMGLKNKIFEPYFTTKEARHGSGLGLYMSKQIVETNLHGTITVGNREFKHGEKNLYGACFKIVLTKSRD